MAQVRLTDRTAKEAKGPLPGGDDVEHWDAELAGFGLRVTSKGKRTWIVRYRLGTSRPKVSLGSTAGLPAAKARKEAQRILSAAELGHDEAAEIKKRKADAGKPATLTLMALAERFLAHASTTLAPTTLTDTARYLRTVAAPLHKEEANSVSMRQIATLLSDVERTTGKKVAVNRLRSALSSCFRWAMGEGMVDANPVIGTNKRREKPRDRVLSASELAAIWAACGDDDYGRIVKLLMLTGQRRDEVGAMRWSELNLALALWSLPSGRVKNKQAHDVPLSDPVLSIIGEVPRRALTPVEGEGAEDVKVRDLLFGSKRGPFAGWSKSKAALDRRQAENAAARRLGRPLQDGEKPSDDDRPSPWTVHDLRRTVSTGMGEHLGVAPHIVEATLNHISGAKRGVAGVYNRARYMRERRDALVAWADWVMATVQGERPKVVPFRANTAS